MQENNTIQGPHHSPSSPGDNNRVSHSPPSTPQLIIISPAIPASSSLQRGESRETEDVIPSSTTSPKNSAAVITPTPPRTASGGSGSVGRGPAGGGGHQHQNEQHDSGNLHRTSSSESISAESGVYTVPIKYRSGVGSFEDHVSSGFANLFSSSNLSDVTIACDGKLIKAHKIVLAISSPYFRQIFEVSQFSSVMLSMSVIEMRITLIYTLL